MRYVSRLALVVIASFVIAWNGQATHAQDKQQPRTIRLLTIGNSFAENASTYLPAIFKADSEFALELGKANIGGCTLERHWKYASDPSDAGKRYKRYEDGKAVPATLTEKLKEKRWDVITLQQMSAESWRPERYHPYAENLVKMIREQAPQAQIVFHQTWAYRSDAPLLAEWKVSREEMYGKLNDAYGRVAKQFECAVIPAGAAFNAYRARPDRQYVADADFDFKNPPAKGKPKQDHSLVVGWYRNKQGKFGLDFKHTNQRGAYLLGAVWYESLAGRDVRKNTFKPPRIPADELQRLQEIAHQTVAEYQQPAVKLPIIKTAQ